MLLSFAVDREDLHRIKNRPMWANQTSKSVKWQNHNVRNLGNNTLMDPWDKHPQIYTILVHEFIISFKLLKVTEKNIFV
jgi:hypothetical protein